MKQGTQKCGIGRRRRIQAAVATKRAEGRGLPPERAAAVAAENRQPEAGQ